MLLNFQANVACIECWFRFLCKCSSLIMRKIFATDDKWQLYCYLEFHNIILDCAASLPGVFLCCVWVCFMFVCVLCLEKHSLRSVLSSCICFLIITTSLCFHTIPCNNNCTDRHLYFIDYMVSWILSDCCSTWCLPSYGWWRGLIDFLLWFTGASVCKWTHPKPVNSSKFHKVMARLCTAISHQL